MKRNETAFLICVLCVALAVAGLSVERCAERVLAPGEPAAAGAGGRPRDVDLAEIRRLIREGALSDREALFYTDSPEPGPRPGAAPGPGGGP